jgi:hypothetical protein
MKNFFLIIIFLGIIGAIIQTCSKGDDSTEGSVSPTAAKKVEDLITKKLKSGEGISNQTLTVINNNIDYTLYTKDYLPSDTSQLVAREHAQEIIDLLNVNKIDPRKFEIDSTVIEQGLTPSGHTGYAILAQSIYNGDSDSFIK